MLSCCGLCPKADTAPEPTTPAKEDPATVRKFTDEEQERHRMVRIAATSQEAIKANNQVISDITKKYAPPNKPDPEDDKGDDSKESAANKQG